MTTVSKALSIPTMPGVMPGATATAPLSLVGWMEIPSGIGPLLGIGFPLYLKHYLQSCGNMCPLWKIRQIVPPEVYYPMNW